MSSGKKIAAGVFWTTLVNVISGVYGFISVPILLNYFGKSDYGLIGLAMSVNVYLRLLDMGMTSTNVRFFSNYLSKGEPDKVRLLFGTSLSFYGMIGLINAAVLLIVSFFCESLFNLDPGQVHILRNLFLILSISAFISWFTACFDQLIRANEEVGWTQRMTLLPKIVQIVVLVLTVSFRWSIELYYALTTFSMFLIIPFMASKIKRIFPYVSFVPSFDKALFKEILPYSINIFSFGLFQFSVNYLRPVFLGMQGTVESVADYRVLNGIVSIVIMLGGAFLGVILPSASKAVATGDTHAQYKVAYKGTQYITIALCFCCFGMISVAREVITLYVGDSYQYLTGWLIAWLVTTLMTHNQAISSLILAGSDIRAITYNTIAASVIALLICWFTIPSLQIGGTIIAYGVYGVLQLLFYYVYYWPRKMGINSWKVFTRSFIPYVAIGAIISSFLSGIHLTEVVWGDFVIKGALFTTIYMVLVLATFRKEDYDFFKQLLGRK